MLFDCFSMPLTFNIWFLWIAIIAYHRYQFIIFVPPSLCHRQFQEVIEVIETFEAEMDALTWEVPCAAPLLELKEWNVPAPSKARETLEACYSQKSCDISSAMTKCIQLSFVGICRFKKPITSESRMKGIQLGRNVCFCSTVLLFSWSIRFLNWWFAKETQSLRGHFPPSHLARPRSHLRSCLLHLPLLERKWTQRICPMNGQ